jgi:fatty acid desaturase
MAEKVVQRALDPFKDIIVPVAYACSVALVCGFSLYVMILAGKGVVASEAQLKDMSRRIGTKNPAVARFVCLITVIALIGVLALMIFTYFYDPLLLLMLGLSLFLIFGAFAYVRNLVLGED